jgi:hypothetical protein
MHLSKNLKCSLGIAIQRKAQPSSSVHESLALSGFAFFHQQLWHLTTHTTDERLEITSLVAITLDGLKSMACTKDAGK